MTTQESFKKRIRARMAATGEKYGTARRVLLDQAARKSRARAAEPEVPDASVETATGRDWNAWCCVLDTFDDRDDFSAVAEHVHDAHGIDEWWWANQVALGYHRITGRRAVGQQADGTYAANKSATMAIDAGALRAMLLDDADRADLFGDDSTVLRSRATSKTIRLGIADTIAMLTIDDVGDGRARVAVQHTKLPDADAILVWKSYWSAWLHALADG